MAKPSFKFSGLRLVLADLGFKQVPVTKPYLGFQNDQSDTLIVLPSYRSNSAVAPHHLAQVHIKLDAIGLIAAENFDRNVAGLPVGHSASS
jgi:hypothetical protein